MRRLKGVDARLVSVLKEVVKHYDITILEGLRTEDRQRELMAKGASKTMKSKHLEGMAADVSPYPIPNWEDVNEFIFMAGDVSPYPIPNWEDVNEFIFMAGRIRQEADRLGVPIRWGGDWDRDDRTADNKFNDYVHFEIYDK